MRFLCLVLFAAAVAAQAADRAVVLFDSAAAPTLASGWGYSLYVEHGGKRILFDTGRSGEGLAQNAKALGIDLSKLDAVIVSHDDSDHFAALGAVAAVHPKVPVYVPESEYGAFGLATLNGVYRFFESLMPRNDVVAAPKGLRYIRVAGATTIWPGYRLIAFDFGDGRREQALVIERAGGAVLISGCAHAGIGKMVRGAGSPVRMIVGGFHLVDETEGEIRKVVADLKAAGVRAAVPGHCTGAKATVELRRVMGGGVSAVAAGGSFGLAGE